MPSAAPLRSVLHVLPHPGGGGETYVDALSQMEGYRFERSYLAKGPDPKRARLAIVRRAVEIQRAASSFDVVHVVGEVASALCLPTLAWSRSVVSPQGLSLLRRTNGAAAIAARANIEIIVRAATRTICASNDEYSKLIRATHGRAGRRAVVIHNGVPIADRVSPDRRAALRAEFGISEGRSVGAWLGALDEHKDPLTAVRAVKTLRRSGVSVALLVAGDGPLRADVERAAQETDAIHVLGFRRDVDRILCASDFYVLSSQREGFSFALLEAMSFGLAPVVSDAPANIEAVGDVGIVVPFGDSDRFAEAFAFLAGNDAELRALGRRARERVAQNFHVDEMMRKTREVYEEVVRERANRRTRRGAAAGSPRG